MKITREKLKELLVDPGHIDEAQFELLAKTAEKEKKPLDRLIVDNGLVSDENLGKTIADSFNYRFIDLRKKKITSDLLGLIPEVVAHFQKAVVFECTKEILKLATLNPENYEFIKLLEEKTRLKIEVYYATSLGIEESLKYYKSDLEGQVKNLIDDLVKDSQGEENIVELVNLFLEYAHDNSASDIHIEPSEKTVSLRFRIDGVLYKAVEYPRELHDKIVFRIKIMSRLRTDEHAAAQDGRFDYKKNNIMFDVRVSILPITDGENVVLRLLVERAKRLSLEVLGLLGTDLKKVKKAASKRQGMLLSVGPTGCGKTTSLYSVLQILNKPEVNIMTIEDPVEYNVECVQQTQVNPKKNLTFATGLRSIVRQDPDIIMVGEIRDNETAKIAINAAMTGHLLLSTLHTNDAATTFPRLIEMGIEPFLLASSINVIIAQRLVRKICDKCKMSYSLRKEELEMLEAEPNLSDIIKKVFFKEDFSKMTFYRGAGCKSCSHTGYRDRTGIFEVMEISEELRSLISQKKPSDIIDKKAKELGMASMLHDGITKVSYGITTLEEVVRMTKT